MLMHTAHVPTDVSTMYVHMWMCLKCISQVIFQLIDSQYSQQVYKHGVNSCRFVLHIFVTADEWQISMFRKSFASVYNFIVN